jgi:predicted metal-dependent phosphoesterase TrpH
MRTPQILLVLLIALAPFGELRADVRLIMGPTPIPRGKALAAGDITVVNEKLAFALAVQSPAPYGVPRGAIVDVAPVSNGHIGRSRVVFADFIPNNWSAWPNTYHHVDVLERGPRQVRIRAVRDFGAATVTTLYTLAAGADAITITTTMRNGGTTPMADLLSGLTLWPNSGFLFPVPGMAGVKEGKADGALADRVVAYDADWTVALHAPYFDHVGSGSRDLFLLHTLKPGESRTFTGSLQVGARGDLAPVVQAEIARRHWQSATVHGAVSAQGGAAIERPVVVVEKAGKPYAWVLGEHGNYRLALPPGGYSLYATGPNYARSPATQFTVTAGSDRALDFHDLGGPGQVEFQIASSRGGAPLDARLSIERGEKPLVEFLGRTTFFTDLAPRGHATLNLAPGDYQFRVSSGAGFLSADVQTHVNVLTGRTSTARITIVPLFDPPSRGWYAADLHHHADQAEAVTPAPDLARSQLAAGLDLLFVSDHDSTANHEALRSIAAARGVPFIAGIELSPSWGHFNAYPLAPGATLQVDTSTASVGQILAEARREGASVVQVNHPFIPYGYFASLEHDLAPGGFSPAFDLIEINSSNPGDDAKVFERACAYWNTGQHYYLSGGSDTHDVWNEQSGRVRAYAHVEGRLTTQAWIEALKNGHGYVTYGPLIFPTVMFGTRLAVAPQAGFTLGFDLAAVPGLKEVTLVHDGAVEIVRELPGAPRESHVDFKLLGEDPTWYALIVEDESGRKAYTNPIWIAPSAAVPHKVPGK